MATKRFGYLDDLSLKNTNVGIGTSTANEKLEVLGGTRGGSAVVTGIATLTSYSGFQNKNTSYTGNIKVESGESGTLSGEVVVGAGLTMSVGTGATTGQGSIKSLKVSNTFTPPIGGINDRPSAPQPGTLFYNKDFKTIEYWDGNFWRQVDNTTTRGRGLIMGGKESDWTTDVEFIETATKGNGVQFGDLTVARGYPNCTSDGTRGIAAGGSFYPGHATSLSNTIDYNTIASAGNSIDFGDTNASVDPGPWGDGAAASSTRAVIGAWSGATTLIEYIQMQTVGNAVDFGDKMSAVAGGVAAVSNPTRGVWMGGYNPYNVPAAGYHSISRIEYVTIASTGNTVQFGDLTREKNAAGGASNSVRGLAGGGIEYRNSSTRTNNIDYIAMATLGNAVEFGSLTVTRSHGSAMGTNTRGIFSGLHTGSVINTIDYVTIATTGNAEDFGDLTTARKEGGCATDSHGGLGGF